MRRRDDVRALDVDVAWPREGSRRLGPYELLGRLGQGGMGTVYLARSPQGRRVAIKVVRADLSYDDEFRRRFRSEVNRVRQVPPFCTAEVLDADPDNDPPYLVVEYVDGPTLADVVREHGTLSGSRLHTLAVATATALAAIHGAGVIHRDFKPANVLLAVAGVKVIDFGIARPLEATSHHTRTDQLVGTVEYMAPERFDSEPATHIGPAADIFAWGAVITYAATGSTPFAADSAAATAVRILTQPPNLTGLSGQLFSLVARTLAKDPGDRPTAQELLRLLVSQDNPIVAPSSPVIRPGPTAQTVYQPDQGARAAKPAAHRHRLRKSLVAAATAVTVAITGILLADKIGAGPPASNATVGPGRSSSSEGLLSNAAPTVASRPTPDSVTPAILAGKRRTLIRIPTIDRYVTLPLRKDATVSDRTDREAVFTLFPIGGTTYMIESTTRSPSDKSRCVSVASRDDDLASLRSAECFSNRQMLFDITSTGQTDSDGRPTYLITSDFHGEVGWDEIALRLTVYQDTAIARTAFSFVDRGAL